MSTISRGSMLTSKSKFTLTVFSTQLAASMAPWPDVFRLDLTYRNCLESAIKASQSTVGKQRET